MAGESGIHVDKDLLRNGSGYVDITAYKAINNLERMKKMEFKRGEVFEYETNSGEIKSALVVSADFRAESNYINIIMLTDAPKGDVNVPIRTSGGMMYADCGMVSFALAFRMGQFLRVTTDDEMAQIDEGICKCLGLESKTIEVPVEKVVEVTPSPVQYSEELATAKAEANVYKGLYERLLATMMGGVNNGGK